MAPNSEKRLDGKKTAQEVRDLLKGRVARLKEKGIVPGLSVTLVGEDPASKVYVGAKDAAAKEVGMNATTHRLPADISEADLRAHLIAQNNDPAVHGILLQLPLPKHLPEDSLLNLIAAEKDVDGFHPVSLGNVMLGRPGFKPCTPWGVQVLLRRYGISLKGKHVVIVGRSNIVGKPLANLLVQKADDADATVTVCHSGTKDLARFTREADVLVAAIGRGEFITGDMVKDGAVVVDVGMNRVDDASLPKGYRLCGDVDFQSVEPKASFITPVPGGVGPMTIAMLLANTVWSAERGAGIVSQQDPFAN
jgi:methylenetetrahydrofolate dehydrogenase (NADP+)/methenyltetrahydrofolate cyclohydrolase